MIYHMPMGTAPSARCEQRVSLGSAFPGTALVSRRAAGSEERGLDQREVRFIVGADSTESQGRALRRVQRGRETDTNGRTRL